MAIYTLGILVAIIVGVSTGIVADREMNGHRIVRDIRNGPERSPHAGIKPQAPIRQSEPGRPYDDPHPLICSRITYVGKYINSTITYKVPEGWSVWSCLKERFPEWNDRGLMSSIEVLRFYMSYYPSLKYHDPDHIPVGYTMVGGGDGGGPNPTNE